MKTYLIFLCLIAGAPILGAEPYSIPKCDDRIEKGAGDSILVGTIGWHPFGGKVDTPYLKLSFVKDKLGWRHFRNYLDATHPSESMKEPNYVFRDNPAFIDKWKFTIAFDGKKLGQAEFEITKKPDPRVYPALVGGLNFRPFKKVDAAKWPKRLLVATSNGTFVDPENWKVEKQPPINLLDQASKLFAKMYPRKYYCRDLMHDHGDGPDVELKKLSQGFLIHDLKIVKTYVSKNKNYVVGILWNDPSHCANIDGAYIDTNFSNNISLINWFFIEKNRVKHIMAASNPTEAEALDIDNDGKSEWLFSSERTGVVLFTNEFKRIDVPYSYDPGCS